MSGLLEHWEIKLIALIMAVTLYAFTADLIRVDKTFTVVLLDEHVVGLPEDYRVRSIEPPDLTFEVSGPVSLLGELEVEDIQPRLTFSADQLQEGRQTFEVTSRLLGLPPDMRLNYVNPQRVVVEVDRWVEARVPIVVGPEDFQLEAPGLVVREVRLDRSSVTVEGPARAIERLRSRGQVRLAPQRVPDVDRDITDPVQREVPLEVDLDDEVRVVEPTALTATVTVAPVPEGIHVSLPINILASPGFFRTYAVELHQDEVAVTVRGPRNRLQAQPPREVFQAYVDLTGKPTLDIPQLRPVTILTPPWASAGAAQVRVTVRLREPAAASAEGGAAPAPPPAEEAPPAP